MRIEPAERRRLNVQVPKIPIPGNAASPQPVRAAPITLRPTMSIEAALQKIGLACLAHLLRNEPAAVAGNPEGVHQMRVASRRIRSMISDL